jgi:hypothetical protein
MQCLLGLIIREVVILEAALLYNETIVLPMVV